MKLTPNIDKDGRPKGSMKINGVRHRVSISRKLWMENYGPIEKGYIVHHIDHNPGNNDLTNLKLMTKKEHDQHHNIITLDFDSLKEKHAEGYTLQKLAELNNCGVCTIRRGFRKRNWTITNYGTSAFRNGGV